MSVCDGIHEEFGGGESWVREFANMVCVRVRARVCDGYSVRP